MITILNSICSHTNWLDSYITVPACNQDEPEKTEIIAENDLDKQLEKSAHKHFLKELQILKKFQEKQVYQIFKDADPEKTTSFNFKENFFGTQIPYSILLHKPTNIRNNRISDFEKTANFLVKFFSERKLNKENIIQSIKEEIEKGSLNNSIIQAIGSETDNYLRLIKTIASSTLSVSGTPGSDCCYPHF